MADATGMSKSVIYHAVLLQLFLHVGKFADAVNFLTFYHSTNGILWWVVWVICWRVRIAQKRQLPLWAM